MSEEMTRKEAIETLKVAKAEIEWNYPMDYQTALDMAIASLETDEAYDLMYEQPEWCKDCISREQAIKEFCKQTCDTPNCRFRDKGVVHASCDEVDVLKRLPSVLPKATKDNLKVDYLGVDCIDRQATLGAIIKRLGIRNESYLLPAERTIYQQIKDMPPATPQEPRKGHWVKTPKAVMGEGYIWYCDKCEHQVYQDSSRDYPSEKYCPNCGSDNREVEE